MKKFSSCNQKRGELAETLACQYMMSRGFSILERNYTKRYGEIDIIAQRGGVVYFIEVKSVSRENLDLKPEDHMDRNKLLRLSRIISSYINERDISLWQIDLICIVLDHGLRRALIRRSENVILTEN